MSKKKKPEPVEKYEPVIEEPKRKPGPVPVCVKCSKHGYLVKESDEGVQCIKCGRIFLIG